MSYPSHLRSLRGAPTTVTTTSADAPPMPSTAGDTLPTPGTPPVMTASGGSTTTTPTAPSSSFNIKSAAIGAAAAVGLTMLMSGGSASKGMGKPAGKAGRSAASAKKAAKPTAAKKAAGAQKAAKPAAKKPAKLAAKKATKTIAKKASKPTPAAKKAAKPSPKNTPLKGTYVVTGGTVRKVPTNKASITKKAAGIGTRRKPAAKK